MHHPVTHFILSIWDEPRSVGLSRSRREATSRDNSRKSNPGHRTTSGTVKVLGRRGRGRSNSHLLLDDRNPCGSYGEPTGFASFENEGEGRKQRSVNESGNVCMQWAMHRSRRYSIETLLGQKEDNRGLGKREEEIENLQENCQIFKS